MEFFFSASTGEHWIKGTKAKKIEQKGGERLEFTFCFFFLVLLSLINKL